MSPDHDPQATPATSANGSSAVVATVRRLADRAPVLAAALLGGFLLAAYAIDIDQGLARAGLFVIGAAAASFGAWRFSDRYTAWARPRITLVAIGSWIGIALAWIGCWLLEIASDHDLRSLAAAAVAVVLAGFVPISFAISVDTVHHETYADTYTNTISAAGRPWSRHAIAWALNVFTMAAPIFGGVWILGAPWLIGAGATALWVLSTAVARTIHRAGFYFFAGTAAGLAVAGLAVAWLATSSQLVAIAVALVVFLVGGSVVARWVRCRTGVDPTPRPVTHGWLDAPRARRAAGAAAVVASLASMLILQRKLGDASTSQLLTVTAVFLLLGASSMLRGEGYVLLAVVGVTAVWVVTDRDAVSDTSGPLVSDITTAWRSDDPNVVRVIALGDSYTSGEGASTFIEGTNVEGSNTCRRATTAYPYRVAQQFGWQLGFFACSGALSEHIAAAGGADPDAVPNGRFQIDMVGDAQTASIDLVLLSIGGNDALFSTIGKACALPGSCTDISQVFESNLTFVSRKVETALVATGERFPNARIVLVPYPKMLGKESCPNTPLDEDEFDYLNAFLDSLNKAGRQAADGANETLAGRVSFFRDGARAYTGEEFCSDTPSGGRPMNVITIASTDGDSLFERIRPDHWIHNSFHPTEHGHQLMACALERYLVDTLAEPLRLGGNEPERVCNRLPELGPTATAADGETIPPEAATCDNRLACRAAATRFIASTGSNAIREVLLPAVLLLISGAGFAVLYLVHRSRHPLAPPTG